MTTESGACDRCAHTTCTAAFCGKAGTFCTGNVCPQDASSLFASCSRTGPAYSSRHQAGRHSWPDFPWAHCCTRLAGIAAATAVEDSSYVHGPRRFLLVGRNSEGGFPVRARTPAELVGTGRHWSGIPRTCMCPGEATKDVTAGCCGLPMCARTPVRLFV